MNDFLNAFFDVHFSMNKRKHWWLGQFEFLIGSSQTLLAALASLRERTVSVRLPAKLPPHQHCLSVLADEALGKLLGTHYRLIVSVSKGMASTRTVSVSTSLFAQAWVNSWCFCKHFHPRQKGRSTSLVI